MKKILGVLQKIENFIIAASFIIMTLSAFGQVVNRNVIGMGISWFEELSRYSMVYMGLLGTEVGLRDGTQIAITALVDKFSVIPKRLAAIFAKLVTLAFSSIVFYCSFDLLDKQISFGQISPGLQIPMYIPYVALPLSFGLITVVQTVALVVMAGELFRNVPEAVKGEQA